MKQWLAEKSKKFLAGDFGRLFFYLLFALIVLKLLGVLFLWQFNNSLLFTDVSKTVLIDLVNKERKSLGMEELVDAPQIRPLQLIPVLDPVKKDSGAIKLKMSFLRFMVESYDHWLSDLSFTILIFTLFYLGYAELHNFPQRKKNILGVYLCLFLVLALLDKSLVLKIIPHRAIL